MSEELKNDIQEEKRVDEEVSAEELVKKLKEKGIGYFEIIKELDEMLKLGKITQEVYDKAKEELQELEKEEKANASKLFGVDII